MAVVTALKAFKQYLLGRHFTVRTDHSALQWFRRSKEPIGQLGRWLETMEEYDYDIQFRPATKHGNADALSRRPCVKRTCYCHDIDENHVIQVRRTEMENQGQLLDIFDLEWTREELIEQQKTEPETTVLYTAIESGKGSRNGRRLLSYRKEPRYYGGSGSGWQYGREYCVNVGKLQ